MKDTVVEIRIKRDTATSELTFLQLVRIRPEVTQQEILNFCAEMVERAKKLGREEESE